LPGRARQPLLVDWAFDSVRPTANRHSYLIKSSVDWVISLRDENRQGRKQAHPSKKEYFLCDLMPFGPLNRIADSLKCQFFLHLHINYICLFFNLL